MQSSGVRTRRWGLPQPGVRGYGAGTRATIRYWYQTLALIVGYDDTLALALIVGYDDTLRQDGSGQSRDHKGASPNSTDNTPRPLTLTLNPTLTLTQVRVRTIFLNVDPGIELGLTVFVTSKRYRRTNSAQVLKETNLGLGLGLGPLPCVPR